MKKKIATYGLFVLGTILLLLDGLTPLQIGNSIAYAILLLVTIAACVLTVGYYLLKLDFKGTLKISIIIGGLAIIVQGLLSWGGDWKTQTVIYKNLHLSNRTIEFQMQDVGALGYNRRTVDRIKIFPFIDWIEEVDIKNIGNADWERVDVDVNEIGLKGG